MYKKVLQFQINLLIGLAGTNNQKNQQIDVTNSQGLAYLNKRRNEIETLEQDFKNSKKDIATLVSNDKNAPEVFQQLATASTPEESLEIIKQQLFTQQSQSERPTLKTNDFNNLSREQQKQIHKSLQISQRTLAEKVNKSSTGVFNEKNQKEFDKTLQYIKTHNDRCRQSWYFYAICSKR